MSMLFVCERERGGTYILHVNRILERYLPFQKSENAWTDRMKSYSVTAWQHSLKSRNLWVSSIIKNLIWRFRKGWGGTIEWNVNKNGILSPEFYQSPRSLSKQVIFVNSITNGTICTVLLYVGFTGVHRRCGWLYWVAYCHIRSLQKTGKLSQDFRAASLRCLQQNPVCGSAI